MSHISTTLFAVFFAANLAKAQYPVLTSSFTWNENCGPTVACGPSAAGVYGTGYAAANNVTYAAGKPIVGGVGAGCGQCWHLQPISDEYTSNGLKLGTPVVVKINDQCTDPGYCDQEEGSNTADVNTKYGKDVHFDLCNATGVTNQFFGQIGAGVAIGYAQQLPDCSALDDGPFGSELGTLNGGASNAGGVPASGALPGIALGALPISASEPEPSLSLNALEQFRGQVNGAAAGEKVAAPVAAVGKEAANVVVAGAQSTTMAVMVSSSVIMLSNLSTSYSVAVQSSTLAAAVSSSALLSSSSASPSTSSSGVALEDNSDEQDDCEEL
ncbi:hypothetical protein P7C71_g2935, partial [Lecanoromycetidae sp. Uapishka_2]